jgi:CheY-like chemotaxis protein
MILFVDDEASKLIAYVDALRRVDPDVVVVESISELELVLATDNRAPACIVLDVMFPSMSELPTTLAANGTHAGAALFGLLRTQYPATHVIVLTSSTMLAVRLFFEVQQHCTFVLKTDITPSTLALLVTRIVSGLGATLLERFAACDPGKRDAALYEALGMDCLTYLFMPPQRRIFAQVRRQGGTEIRDAIIANTAETYFWKSLRREFDAKHVVVEFKNYVAAIGKPEVDQLRIYLQRKTLGRFGILMSRAGASQSALRAQRDAYCEQDCLVLFLDDATLREMIEMRLAGADPAAVLERLREQFEINY